MSHTIYSYIRTHFSHRPEDIDRLIVSAFFRKSNVKVQHNRFLKSFIIEASDSEISRNVDELLSLINQHFKVFDIETLIELFEFVISPADKVVTGAVYTPLNIRDFIVQKGGVDQHKFKSVWRAADVACGCGGFLCSIVKEIRAISTLSYKEIFENHIFGLDIKEYSVRRSKILLSILAICDKEDIEKFQFNLFVGDALAFEWHKVIPNFTGFSFIAGNPPYVSSKRIDPKTKKYLKKFEVCSTGRPDLYIPFFQVGIELLAEGGILGFITMNTFLKSLNGRALRKFFGDKSLDFTIIDFGTLQVFKGKSTYTCVCLIQNSKSDVLRYSSVDSVEKLKGKIVFNELPYLFLNAFKGWNLKNAKTVAKIEAVGVPFAEKFKTRNGIATLKNDVYIFAPLLEDDDFYYLQNGDLYPIEKGVCKDIINPNYLASSKDLNDISEKIIFPYQFEGSKAQLLTSRQISESYPMAYRYLLAKKKILKGRDKGLGKYERWFAFGRTQSLSQMEFKLFFPHITPQIPFYIINDDPDLLFYNGIAVIGESLEDLKILSKLMSTTLFWFYIRSTSKPYTAEFYSLSRNYIKDFGICNLTDQEKEFVLLEEDKDSLNTFFEKKYGVSRQEISES